jgi:hypothetical protein
MIPYNEGRKHDEEATKLKEKVDSIGQNTREAAWALN